MSDLLSNAEIDAAHEWRLTAEATRDRLDKYRDSGDAHTIEAREEIDAAIAAWITTARLLDLALTDLVAARDERKAYRFRLDLALADLDAALFHARLARRDLDGSPTSSAAPQPTTQEDE